MPNKFITIKERQKIMQKQIHPEGQLSYNSKKNISDFIEQACISLNHQFFNNNNENINAQIIINGKEIMLKRQIVKQYICLFNTKLESTSQNTNFQQLHKVINKWPNQLIRKKVGTFENNLRISQNCHYFGDLHNQTIHGYGLMIYFRNCEENQGTYQQKTQTFTRFYQGQFQNNQKHGSGLQLFNNSIYIGNFTNNQPDGDYGLLLTYNFGFSHIIQMYFGSFLNGQKHGQGKWKGQSGEYFGNWKFNQPDGEGQLISKQSRFRGSIKGGYKHGIGKQLFQNGDRYQGEYLSGKPQGKGVYYWNNGAVYRGEFKNGFRHGHGQWKFASQIYKGDYINDKRWGEGKYYWNQINFYQGSFFDDLRHGYGEMSWNQSTVYKGEWKHGYQCGKGQIFVNNQLSQGGIYENGALKEPFNILQKQKKQTNIEKNKIIQIKNQKHLNKKTQQMKRYQPKLKNSLFQSNHLNLKKQRIKGQKRQIQ